MIPPIARRFVAGETTAEALAYVETINDRNIGAILNVLGEHYQTRKQATTATNTYCDLLHDLADTNLDVCVSIKPSHVGLDVDESVFKQNTDTIIAHARKHDQFVWFDMEDYPTTTATITRFEILTDQYPHGVGVCLQANLDRTTTDVQRLAGLPGRIRLVKGAYNPPSEIGYTDRARVNSRFKQLLDELFRSHEHGIAVASHDPDMIDHALELHEIYGTPFEIQMLMGVREDAQTDLARTHSVWQYVPFGDQWISYFYRRIKERKGNVLFAVRALLDR